ncbi:MAG: rhomboid family intramembrane serine protease [Verrucomicrobiota bacterium]
MTSSGGPFSNVARNLRQVGSSPACWTWVAVVLGIQLLVTLAGGQDREPAWSWFETFGLNRQEVFAGKIWQVFTYGFLHGGWLHVGVNSVFLLLIGSRIEHMAGHAVMVRTGVFGVLGGGIGHLILAPGGASAPLLVGLSGACVALLLLLTTLSPQSRMMPIPLTGKSLGLGILTAELILALIDPSLGIPGFSTLGAWLVDHGHAAWFELGHACHFGGGLAGWMLGKWLLRPRITLERLRRDRERREASESGRTGMG